MEQKNLSLHQSPYDSERSHCVSFLFALGHIFTKRMSCEEVVALTRTHSLKFICIISCGVTYASTQCNPNWNYAWLSVVLDFIIHLFIIKNLRLVWCYGITPKLVLT